MLAKAVECVKFSVEVAEYQRRHGRFFYFEHPLSAKSWDIPELWLLSQRYDAESVVLHMCRFGLEAEDQDGSGLVKKPTKVLTNLSSIASAIDKQCEGGHRHVHLMSGRAKAAAEYTQDFCRAIVAGIEVYDQHLGEALSGETFLVDEGELNQFGSDMCDPSEEIPFAFNDWGYCVDDVRGGTLPLEWVRFGRQAEMEGFAARRVYEVRPRHEAISNGARGVGVRWVDTLKGNQVRSRLVAQDFNNDKGHNDDMFAATPPLMASRYLVSRMASDSPSGLGALRPMALDMGICSGWCTSSCPTRTHGSGCPTSLACSRRACMVCGMPRRFGSRC